MVEKMKNHFTISEWLDTYTMGYVGMIEYWQIDSLGNKINKFVRYF